MPAEMLSIQPGELKFPFEPRKQISCSLQLANTTEEQVAFKVKTTSPKKYCVRPNTGIISPGATCNVTVTMQAQREVPLDMQCKDKFLVQSVVVAEGAPQNEVSPDLFNKASGKDVNETKLRVVYVSPPQPPSPVPESAEEGVSPRRSLTLDNGFGTASDAAGDLKMKLAEIAKMNEKGDNVPHTMGQSHDKPAAVAEISGGQVNVQRKPTSGFSFLFVLVVGLLGVLVGYLLHFW